MTYANPTWQAYNSALTKITDEGRAIGPLIAINCGHFIQKDGPKFVSDELTSLLDRVVNRVEQVSERVSIESNTTHQVRTNRELDARA